MTLTLTLICIICRYRDPPSSSQTGIEVKDRVRWGWVPRTPMRVRIRVRVRVRVWDRVRVRVWVRVRVRGGGYRDPQ